MAFTTFQDKLYENTDPNSKEPSGHDGTALLTTTGRHLWKQSVCYGEFWCEVLNHKKTYLQFSFTPTYFSHILQLYF